MARLRTAFPALLLALVAACTLAAAARSPGFRIDDAYIVARYAENLALHGRLAWNLDGAPVEGFTGYTLLALMTAAALLRLPPVEVAAAAGAAALLAGAWAVYASRRPLGASRRAGAFGAAVFLGAAEQATHVSSGLETEIFMALSAGCALAAARRCHGPPGAAPRWPLLLLVALCSLTRPEGAAVGGAFLLVTLARERAAWRSWAPGVVAGVGLPLAAVQALRLVYFKSWLPNTYYAKLNREAGLGAFAASFSSHARGYLLPALVALLAAAALARALGEPAPALPPAERSARRALCAGALPCYALLGAAYLRSDLVMNYSERFAFHLFGLSCLLLVLAADGVERCLAALDRERAVQSCARVLVGVCLFFPFATALRRAPDERSYRRAYAGATRTHYQPVAAWLTEHLPASATLAVYPDAGLVPYRTRLRAIDFGKLNDAYLARQARSPSEVADYFFSQGPDAALIHLRGGLRRACDAGADRLLADPRFSAYSLALVSLHNDAGMALFVRR